MPLTLPQPDPPLALHVTVPLSVTPAGKASLTDTSVASETPVFATLTVYVAPPPGVYVALPSSFVTASATAAASASMSVALSFAGLLSTTLAGALIVAVFAMDPLAFGAICALTVYVAVPPFSSVTASLIAPLPPAAHDEPALATQVHETNVIAAGGVSTTLAPATPFGPLLCATIVYVVVPPGVALAVPSVFVIDRSALPVAVNVADAGNGFVTCCADANAPAASVLIRLPATFATTFTLTAARRVGGDAAVRERDARCAGRCGERAAARVRRACGIRDHHAERQRVGERGRTSARSRSHCCSGC